MEEEKVESAKSEGSPDVRSRESLESVIEEKEEPEVKETVSRTEPPRLLNRNILPFEMFYGFIFSSCYLSVSDKKLINQVELDVDKVLFLNNVGYLMAVFANLPVGMFSDTFGRYYVSVFGVVFMVAAGILNLLVHLFSNQILFYSMLACLCISTSTYGIRGALILNEMASTSPSKMEFYIFSVCFGRTFVHVLALTAHLVGLYFSSVKFAHSIGSLTCGVVSLILIIYLKNKLSDTFEKGIISNCIRALRKKDNSEYYHFGRVCFKMMLVLTAVIGFGISGFVLHFVLLIESSIFYEDEPYIAQTGADIVFFILELLTLIFLQFAFLKIFRKWKVDLIDLRLQGIAYNFMGIAMIFLCIGVSGLRHMVQTVENLAQFRIYNGAYEVAILKYDSVFRRIDPGGLTVIKDFPCPEECEMETSIEFENGNLSSTLKGEEVQSFTHIISNSSVRTISTRDPISPKKNKSTFFVITNSEKLNALLLFDEEYPISFRPNFTNHVIFYVPQNASLRGFKLKKSTKVQNFSFKPEVEKIYSLFVYVTKNDTVLNIDELKLELKTSPNPFFIILPALVGAFALAFSKLCLYRFILIESPLKLLGTLTGYLFTVWYTGVVCWVICYTLRSIWITALALFTCLHIIFNFCFSKFHADYLIFTKSDEYRNFKKT